MGLKKKSSRGWGPARLVVGRVGVGVPPRGCRQLEECGDGVTAHTAPSIRHTWATPS